MVPQISDVSLVLSYKSISNSCWTKKSIILHCHMLKLFVMSYLSLSLILALEIMHSANCQRFRKWLTWHISSQYNWIHKTISKISKENKFKCLGSELSLFHERPLDSTLTQINCENYCKLEKYKNKLKVVLMLLKKVMLKVVLMLLKKVAPPLLGLSNDSNLWFAML